MYFWRCIDYLYSLLSQDVGQKKYKGQCEDVDVVHNGAIAVTVIIIVVIIIIIIVITIVINRWIWMNNKKPLLKFVCEPNDDAQLDL